VATFQRFAEPVAALSYNNGVVLADHAPKALRLLFHPILSGAHSLISLKPLQMSHCLIVAVSAVFAIHVQAQERVFRCPGKPVEYINNAEIAKSKGCVLMDGGNITIIQGTTPQPAKASSSSGASKSSTSSSSSRNGSERVDSADQRSRDADARAILTSEMRKAEERLEQARKAYANGEPEKQGIESRNYQRYLDRVAELKAAVVRAESDVSSIRRELDRLSGGTGSPSTTAQ
jgi:hypothetical protein